MLYVFDFGLNGGLLSRSRFGFMFVAMHAVTGSYARQNFVDYLGAKPDSISHGVPLEDFGHGHPDPNLTYANWLMSCIVAMDLISELQVMMMVTKMVLGNKLFV
ncbi:unnamed protein product [Brassica oleracea var. botrytis]|uniref:Uncharacterized protein n=2 Tax=Brassica TaxID=3705 RepID=A0A3P6BE55_BRAOL|nr:unnamed protein product [Brassica oleracea]